MNGWRACCEMVLEELQGETPEVALDSLKRAADVSPDELTVDPERVFGEWLAGLTDDEVDSLPGAWDLWVEGPFMLDEDFERAGQAVYELFVDEVRRRFRARYGRTTEAEEAP